MSSINLNITVKDELYNSVVVTMIDCNTQQSYSSVYVSLPSQSFDIVKGNNVISFNVADGKYLLNNAKFKIQYGNEEYFTGCNNYFIDCSDVCVAYYVFTNEYRCVQSANVNTGQVERKKIDINAYCTGNQPVWENIGQDLNRCPIPSELNPQWDTENFIRTCNSNGTTKYRIFVKGNQNNIVQFNYNNSWVDATIGTNGIEIDLPSDGQCKSVLFRLKGTTNEVWGCVQTFTAEECNTQGELSSGLIQVQIFQECRTVGNSSGVYFKVVPITPVSDITKFNINWERDTTRSLTVPITRLSVNEWIIENNTIKEAAGINVTINNLNDSFTFNIWGNTCNHDGLPLNCSENNRNITLDKFYYNVGESVIATLNTTYNPCGTGINWYNTNIPFANTPTIPYIYTGQIQQFPVTLHAQPNHNNDNCKQCHGWTEVILRGNNITPPPTGEVEIVNQFPTGITGDSDYQIDEGGTFWYNAQFNQYWSQMNVQVI